MHRVQLSNSEVSLVRKCLVFYLKYLVSLPKCDLMDNEVNELAVEVLKCGHVMRRLDN
jgi:hypothetical protein